MDACNRLDCRVLIIEGSASFTNEGVLMGHGYGQPFTLAQFRGLLWSVRARGVWVDRTESPHDTAVWLKMFEAWWGKEKHTSLVNRPGARGVWGKPDQREFGIHFLMGIPGVGSELAGNIYDYFGGIPARWTVNEKELMEVKGVGKGKAKQIFGTLNGSTEKSPD
jgi:ERCC4-type nuclease